MGKKIFNIDLNDYNELQIDNLLNNLMIYLQIENEQKNLDEMLESLEKANIEKLYSYYAFEGELLEIWSHPVSIFFNFEGEMKGFRFTSEKEIYEVMIHSEVLGGDLLTSGTYCALKIKLLNGKVVTFNL